MIKIQKYSVSPVSDKYITWNRQIYPNDFIILTISFSKEFYKFNT